MAGDSSSYLEKISPKDLVFFSPATRKIIAKNDFSYLGVDYDLNLPKDDQSDIRVWGLPQMDFLSPIPLGIFTGIALGACINLYRRRPWFASAYIHLATGAVTAAATKYTYDSLDKYRIDRELVTWDYVKKHPQDFPEVFNAPKKYKDLLMPWSVSR